MSSMQVFLTWSGQRSREVALALRDFIPTVVQFVRPFMSETDIEKGSRWQSDILRQLEAAEVGIICLTPENLNSPWILFEAGALSKKLKDSNTRVCTYLHHLSAAEVQPPLDMFQHTLAEREDTRRLLQDIRRSSSDSSGLSEEGLNRVFDRMWPDLASILTSVSLTADVPRRTEREMLEELVALTRQLLKDQSGLIIPEVRKARAQLYLAQRDNEPFVVEKAWRFLNLIPDEFWDEDGRLLRPDLVNAKTLQDALDRYKKGLKEETSRNPETDQGPTKDG